MLMICAARIAVGFPRFSWERLTPICIDLHILPIKATNEYKFCLLTREAIQCKEPLYLNEMLELRSHQL